MVASISERHEAENLLSRCLTEGFASLTRSKNRHYINSTVSMASAEISSQLQGSGIVNPPPGRSEWLARDPYFDTMLVNPIELQEMIDKTRFATGSLEYIASKDQEPCESRM